MSSFTANASPSPQQHPITAGPFWPEIDVSAVREAIRITGDVTPARMRSVVVGAVMSVTRELVDYRVAQEKAGHAKLSDVPSDQVDGVSQLVQLYRQAVYCATAVVLHERYRSYDATAQGNQRADDLTPTIDEIRRDQRNAISDLLGQRRVTVELI